jgi:hypothetical protein
LEAFHDYYVGQIIDIQQSELTKSTYLCLNQKIKK